MSTRVTVGAVDAVLAAIAIVANIVGACDAIVALLVDRAIRLPFADAVDTEASNAVPIARMTFPVPGLGYTRAVAVTAVILCALVAVVALLVGRALTRLHSAKAAQTNTRNTIGLAGRFVLCPERVVSTDDVRAMRYRDAYAIDTLPIHAFVVVAVVADAGPAAWRSKVASAAGNDAAVIGALVLVVAVLVALTRRYLTAPHQAEREHAHKP